MNFLLSIAHMRSQEFVLGFWQPRRLRGAVGPEIETPKAAEGVEEGERYGDWGGGAPSLAD